MVSISFEDLNRKLKPWKGSSESKRLGVTVKQTKMITNRERPKKNPSYASFADVGCIRDVVVLEVEWIWIIEKVNLLRKALLSWRQVRRWRGAVDSALARLRNE